MSLAAAWGLFVFVLYLLWMAGTAFLAFSLAATGRRLAAIQTAIEAHRESQGAPADDFTLYEAAGLDPIRPIKAGYLRGERFR